MAFRSRYPSIWTRTTFGRSGQGLFRAYGSSLAPRMSLLDIHEEVDHAVANNIPVVALETAVVTHGFPFPENLKLAQSLQNIVRTSGCIPATIGLLEGRIKIGLENHELERLAKCPGPVKISRRDIGPALVNKASGGTTCSATLIFAAMTGIKVFATGGLGGVHRGGQSSMDVSADLPELSRCPVGLVSAGVKSILDIGRTLEYLETLGVPVLAFGDTTDFPAFFSRKSGFQAPYNVSTPRAAAEILHTQAQLGLQHGALIGVPIPEEFEAASLEIQKAVEQAIAESEANGVSKLGKAATPWLLTRVGDLTQQRSLTSNIALLENTALVGSKIAAEYAKLARNSKHTSSASSQYYHSVQSEANEVNIATSQPVPGPAKLMVVGTAAIDITAITSVAADADAGKNSTSPGKVTLSLGGVGRNVAEAAHRMSASSDVLLVSAIGDDAFGRLLSSAMATVGMRTDGLLSCRGSSAVCNMVLDGSGELIGGVADMSISESLDADKVVDLIIKRQPSFVSLDGNLSTASINRIVSCCSERGVNVLFEPTSAIKSTRILPAIVQHLQLGRSSPAVEFVSPNLLELQQLYNAVSTEPFNLTSHSFWWAAIDRMQLGRQFRADIERLSRRVVSDEVHSIGTLGFLVDQGVVQMAVNLLPFFQHIILKCGHLGVVVVFHMPAEVALRSGWLSAPTKRAIVSVNDCSEAIVVQHFPPSNAQDVINVTGAGDTFVGALLAGLVKEPNLFRRPERLEKRINLAQQAAVLTLNNILSVSPDLSTLEK